MIEDFQRALAADALRILGPKGFVLAGSGAIREYGIIARPTEDIDLFATSDLDEETFSDSIEELVAKLEGIGYRVKPHRRSAYFFSAEVERDGETLQFDLGIDYREFPPATLSIGPVLDVRDAVANKLGAMCSRGEPRDYLDTDAIRRSNLLEDEELLALTFEHDPGITQGVFALSLQAVDFVTVEEVMRYGCDEQQLADVKRRLLAWAKELRNRIDTP